MRRVKKIEKIRKHKKLIFFLAFVISLSIASVGYSAYFRDVDIESTGKIIKKDDEIIFVKDINYNTDTICGYEINSVEYNDSSLTVDVDIPELDCIIVYDITIKNNSIYPMKTIKIFSDYYNTEDIIFEFKDIKEGDIILAGETITATLILKYQSELDSRPINTEYNAIIEFLWEEYDEEKCIGPEDPRLECSPYYVNLSEYGTDDIVLTDSILNKGDNYLDNGATIEVNNGIISITGRPSTGWSNILNENLIRWTIFADLTDYNKLSFYAKYGAAHGSMGVFIDSTIRAKYYSYYDAGWHDASDWKYFEVDLSSYTGIHSISLMGGYVDSSGSPTSNTQFKDITFVKD